MAETGNPTQASDDRWIGRTLAGYLILRRLNEGGMGVIYLAQHQSLDRLAAVKFLPQEMATDAGFVELFLREAKAAGKLTHRNMVGVHDAGRLEDGTYYFIMDYIEGRDLASILESDGKLPVLQAVDYCRQAACALAYAHKKTIVHRDIKPENLVLTNEGLIKVVDLGLAKPTGEASSMMTQTGNVLGSANYISPERLSDPRSADSRTDIYSLGATLFHLITGRLPFEGSAALVMSQHLTAPVPDPRQFAPELDERISRIIMKMMVKDPAQRYQTMDEVESALKMYADSGTNPSRTAKLLERALQHSIPWRMVAVVAIVAALVGVGSFLAAQFFFHDRGIGTLTTKTADSPSPPIPAPVSPAQPRPPVAPPLQLADFNEGSRVNLRGGRFGIWTSSNPDPVAHASEAVVVDAESGMMGRWRIDFDLSNPGSYCGSWMDVNKVDASKYDTLRFKARSNDPEGMDLLVELRFSAGGRESLRRNIVRGIKDQWQTVDLKLARFYLPSSALITQVNLVFDMPVTGVRTGTVLIDDIEFIKTH